MIAQSVDSVDGLFGHSEPVDGTAWVFDGILKFAENEIVHVVAHVLVEKRAFKIQSVSINGDRKDILEVLYP